VGNGHLKWFEAPELRNLMVGLETEARRFVDECRTAAVFHELPILRGNALDQLDQIGGTAPEAVDEAADRTEAVMRRLLKLVPRRIPPEALISIGFTFAHFLGQAYLETDSPPVPASAPLLVFPPGPRCRRCGHVPCPCCVRWCDRITEAGMLCCEGACDFDEDELVRWQSHSPRMPAHDEGTFEVVSAVGPFQAAVAAERNRSL